MSVSGPNVNDFISYLFKYTNNNILIDIFDFIKSKAFYYTQFGRLEPV